MFDAPQHQPVPDEELVALLAAIIRQGGGGLSRVADAYLASVSASHIADRLALAGVLVVRPAADGAPGPRHVSAT